MAIFKNAKLFWRGKDKKQACSLVSGIDWHESKATLLTNALPIIPEEPAFSSPLIIQGNLEAYEFLTAAVR